MYNEYLGRVLDGELNVLKQSVENMDAQKVDQRMFSDETFSEYETTLGDSFRVSGIGTFFGKAKQTLNFEPSTDFGWWFDRTDKPKALPIHVSVNSIWTTRRNIVLSAGAPSNYMRMVEHIVALRVGLGLDNVTIKVDSGDPPLFDESSLGMVEEILKAGIVPTKKKAKIVTVKEPVTLGGPNGSFLTIFPAKKGEPKLSIDCAVDFDNCMGKQRIQFDVTKDIFKYGSSARTNANMSMLLGAYTIGKLFADTRNLGYNTKNIVIAGPWCYMNKGRLAHKGKILEPVWHRAALDLLAAIALIDRGRLAGKIVSYKAGHALDVDMMSELYKQDLIEEL
ncbi:MAG: UDP-3-O-acyl-N-acetylglucosamine deacetylase [Kiritimatiellae bacterium]|jgi:UDP-3-O-[3-hydroxymyristoyl] N-acetylglucosamine deacetylase|nr:UDP-3-O-acyl-N-acetylglucosamine deacetylase [Kiritimatiellia bacterium]